MTRRQALLWPAAVFSLSAQDKLLPLDEAVYRKTIAAGKGKVLMVNFWATWCEPCRKEMPALAKLAGKGLQLVTISADEPEDAAAALQFLRKSGVREPAYLKQVKDDDAFIRSVDPKWSGALPALILFDRAGRKVRTFIGETDLKVVEAEIRKLL